MQNNDNKFVNISCHTTLYSWGIHIARHYLKLIWISCNHATADGSSDRSGYCIANARSKATKSCFACGVNVFTIERLVRRLRDTGRVADRLRRGRSRVTTPRQDRNIHLAHLRNRHVTATETALTTVGNHNCHIHPKTVRNRLHEFGLQLVDLILVLFSLVHVARVVWLG